MLLLTRRIGETITSGDNVKMTVLNARGGQVRIGVVAPRVVPVHREEIDERIHRKASQKALR